MGFSLPKNGAKIGMAHGDMNGFFSFFPSGNQSCLINKPRLRLFNWEGTIKKYQIMTIGGIPP